MRRPIKEGERGEEEQRIEVSSLGRSPAPIGCCCETCYMETQKQKCLRPGLPINRNTLEQRYPYDMIPDAWYIVWSLDTA